MRRFLILLIPLILIIPLYSHFFGLGKPNFASPIFSAEPLQIRYDPYGNGDFGAKRSGRRLHGGIDIVASIGTPVYASASGRAYIGKKRNGMGRYVQIHHSGSYKTIYGHLSKTSIYDGQRVKAGQIIGAVGKTGNAWRRLIKPHLHFEIRKGSSPVDPFDGYLKVAIKAYVLSDEEPKLGNER